MGVAIAAMAGLGAVGGLMGSIGQQQQQQAQYHMQRMEAERQNYLNQRKTDEANWAAARKAAITKINNGKIQEASVIAYADMKRQNRTQFQNNAHGIATKWVNQRNMMITEATGKNLRGGMVDRMQAVAGNQARKERLANRRQLASSDEAATNQYNKMLNSRDTLSRQGTQMFVPSPMPLQPDSGFNLGMLSSMLGGGAQGAGQGAGISSALKLG